MKRKEIATLLGLSALSVSLSGCSWNEITQIKTDTEIEIGNECTINVTDYFTLGSKVNVSDIQVDTSSVNTDIVGDYVVNVIYDKNTYNINVSVVDTTAPTITSKSDIEAVERGTESTEAVEDTAVDVKDRDESTFISLEDNSFELEWEQFKAENNITDWTKWQPFFDSLSKEDQEKIMDKYMSKLWAEPAYVYDYSVHALWGSPLWEYGYDDNGEKISAVAEKSWTEYKKSHNLNDWKSFKGHMDSIDCDLLMKLSDSFGINGLTDKENDYIMYILCGIPFDESDYDKDDNFIISSAMSDWADDLIAQYQSSQPSTPSQPSAPCTDTANILPDCNNYCHHQPGDPYCY